MEAEDIGGRLLEYLAGEARFNGEYYVGSKRIAGEASDILDADEGVSARQVGSYMGSINEAYEEVMEEMREGVKEDVLEEMPATGGAETPPDELKWGYTKGTTWDIRPLAVETVAERVRKRL